MFCVTLISARCRADKPLLPDRAPADWAPSHQTRYSRMSRCLRREIRTGSSSLCLSPWVSWSLQSLQSLPGCPGPGLGCHCRGRQCRDRQRWSGTPQTEADTLCWPPRDSPGCPAEHWWGNTLGSRLGEHQRNYHIREDIDKLCSALAEAEADLSKSCIGLYTLLSKLYTHHHHQPNFA